MRKCKVCETTKPYSEMVIDTTTPRKVHYKYLCKQCANAKSKVVSALRKKHPYPSEGTVCPICLKVPPKYYLDHDWGTGEFRGYLCNRCNVALGHFKDSEDILNRAIAYLRG